MELAVRATEASRRTCPVSPPDGPGASFFLGSPKYDVGTSCGALELSDQDMSSSGRIGDMAAAPVKMIMMEVSLAHIPAHPQEQSSVVAQSSEACGLRVLYFGCLS